MNEFEVTKDEVEKYLNQGITGGAIATGIAKDCMDRIRKLREEAKGIGVSMPELSIAYDAMRYAALHKAMASMQLLVQTIYHYMGPASDAAERAQPFEEQILVLSKILVQDICCGANPGVTVEFPTKEEIPPVEPTAFDYIQFFKDILVVLAGAGIATPEKGYMADGGLQLVLDDVKRLARMYKIYKNEENENKLPDGEYDGTFKVENGNHFLVGSDGVTYNLRYRVPAGNNMPMLTPPLKQ